MITSFAFDNFLDCFLFIDQPIISNEVSLKESNSGWLDLSDLLLSSNNIKHFFSRFTPQNSSSLL